MIEVYGIPSDVGRCPGCLQVTQLLDSLGAPYQFYPIMSANTQGIDFIRPTIVTLAKRIGCFPSLSIRYPVIFLDNQRQDFKQLKHSLIALGYDRDKIED